jgi:hypothetical protein
MKTVLKLIGSNVVLLVVLSSAGCAHMTDYWAANAEGEQPITTIECSGPESYALLKPAEGVAISLMASASVDNQTSIRIVMSANNGARLQFTSSVITVSAPDLSEPLKAELTDLADTQIPEVRTPVTGKLSVKEGRNYVTSAALRVPIREFKLRLPDVLVNGRLTALAPVQFKHTSKAYIGFCEN